MKNNNNPTKELYNALELLYNYFNRELFDDELPKVLFTNQRSVNVLGYFSPNRWVDMHGTKCHEIAVNPVYIGRACIIKLMQTMVHEMAHCWQQNFGKTSRNGYHNKEWGKKMISIGLMPSHTGREGGKTTGQQMDDYPIKEGKFIYACVRFLQTHQFTMPWVDKFTMAYEIHMSDDKRLSLTLNAEKQEQIERVLENIDNIKTKEQLTSVVAKDFLENLEPLKLKKNTSKKYKYSCPKCKNNIWGKPKLNVSCGDCSITYQMIDSE